MTVQGGAVGVGNSSLDPLFVDPFGPDGTAGTGEDYRVRAGSPAIDAAAGSIVTVP